LVRSGTGIGSSEFVVESFPSCARELRPQHETVESASTAHVKLVPALMAVAP
jgi:hypothetical protein